MSPRLAIVIGLLAGILAALLVVVALWSSAGPILDAIAPTPMPTVAAVATPSSSAPPPPLQSPSASPSPVPPGTAAASASSPATPRPTPRPSGSGTGASPTPTLNPFGVGLPAPSLVVTALDGTQLDLASLRGKPVWINFMGTYCPPCRDEFPIMNGFQVRYADTGLVIVAVDVGEAPSVVSAFASSLNVTFRMALDPTGAAQKAWKAAALPVHYWIDEAGVVQDAALGSVGPDQMAASLGKILPGVTVTP